VREELSLESIPVAGPWITGREIECVTDAVTNAWYENANVYHERFERSFAAYTGRRYAVALPSCTSAIHLALLSLGIGPGDEVIVPDVTWIASAAPITYVGAIPVFADIEEETWCLSAESFEGLITSRTRAVIPVDLYGGMPEMDRIQKIADRHGVSVIEDAAEAIGSEYLGRKAGGFGDVSVFSFHGSKTLTTGEGGMLLTDDKKIYERVLFLRDHGRRPGDTSFCNSEVAYKYKMSSMQAALGYAQIGRIDELIQRKREIFSWYQSELSGFGGIRLNSEPPGTKNSFWMVTAITDGELDMMKEDIIGKMAERKIDCRPFFHPLSSLPAYRDSDQAVRARGVNLVSYRISPCGINLPSGMKLTREQVGFVCDNFKEVICP